MLKWQDRQNQKRNQPWLLLWLVPYLIFGFASNSLHNHPLNENSSPSWSLHPEQHTDHAGVGALHLHAHDHSASGAECFTCDWALQAVGNLTAPAVLPVLQAVAQKHSAVSLAPTIAAHTLFFSRGPPLS